MQFHLGSTNDWDQVVYIQDEDAWGEAVYGEPTSWREGTIPADILRSAEGISEKRAAELLPRARQRPNRVMRFLFFTAAGLTALVFGGLAFAIQGAHDPLFRLITLLAGIAVGCGALALWGKAFPKNIQTKVVRNRYKWREPRGQNNHHPERK